MTLPLPYSGIGAPLPRLDDSRFLAELQRRLEGIQGNFDEVLANADKPIVNRKLKVATEESTSSTSFTTLSTADHVSNVWLPEDGIMFVLYHATWKSSVAAAGNAAIFLGENQLQTATIGAAPSAQAAGTSLGVTNTYQVLGSFHGGLTCYARPAISSTVPSAYGGDVTTGQTAGGTAVGWFYNDTSGGTSQQVTTGGMGPAFIFADPGTYDVSVRFLATSGTVTVKDRRLWVWTMDF